MYSEVTSNAAADAPAQGFESIFRNALAEMVRCCNEAHTSSMTSFSCLEKERERMRQICRNTITHGIPAEHQRQKAKHVWGGGYGEGARYLRPFFTSSSGSADCIASQNCVASAFTTSSWRLCTASATPASPRLPTPEVAGCSLIIRTVRRVSGLMRDKM